MAGIVAGQRRIIVDERYWRQPQRRGRCRQRCAGEGCRRERGENQSAQHRPSIGALLWLDDRLDSCPETIRMRWEIVLRGLETRACVPLFRMR